MHMWQKHIMYTSNYCQVNIYIYTEYSNNMTLLIEQIESEKTNLTYRQSVGLHQEFLLILLNDNVISSPVIHNL